jgi:3-deoxy-D-manno-octulosonate 8-phosphate phosphatase (KDO 8-P phosphatase)
MALQLSDFKLVKHFIFDIDGVLTNGSLIIQNDGSLLRTMNIKDGYAMQLAIKKGFPISIISGGGGEGLQKRLAGLGISDIHLGVTNKKEKLLELIALHKLDVDTILYCGDDMPDREVMQLVFLPCCPADACHEIKAISKFISPFNGGEGCVRDVIEKVLKLHSMWE